MWDSINWKKKYLIKFVIIINFKILLVIIMIMIMIIINC